MALSVFDDKAHEPRAAELSEVLGTSAELWSGLISRVRSELGPVVEEWGFAGKKWGWSLRLKRQKRAVLYMTPADGHFHVGFALGQRAVDAAHEAGLPAPVLEVIDNAPRYAEGRGVRLEIRSIEDVRAVVLLARIKMAS